MRDSRGVRSTTLKFVSVSWAVITIKFLVAGIEIPTLGLMPPMTATEFGISVTAVLAIWLGREYTEKVSTRGTCINAAVD